MTYLKSANAVVGVEYQVYALGSDVALVLTKPPTKTQTLKNAA